MLDLLGEHGTIKTEIVRWWYIGLLCGLCLKKAVYRKYAVFFMLKVYRFVAEIISTIRVANAIINDNASYTLMLITSLSRGKPNTSNYLMEFSIPDLLPGFKEKPLFVIHKAIPSLSNRLW